jgi:hypothetical protein
MISLLDSNVSVGKLHGVREVEFCRHKYVIRVVRDDFEVRFHRKS